MNTQICCVRGVPPNFERLAAKFPQARELGTIFTYGAVVYYTGDKAPTRELVAHEAVHAARQMAHSGGPEAWWERYCEDALFRLDEELYTHHAELIAARKRHGHRTKDLQSIAARLAGPLYGRLLTVDQARHALLTGVVA